MNEGDESLLALSPTRREGTAKAHTQPGPLKSPRISRYRPTGLGALAMS